MDEKKLIKKAMKGNPDAYGQLIGRYQDVLYRTAFLHVKSEQVALDMVSETVIRGYENVQKLRKPDFFKTWLIRILLNNINDYYRKNSRVISMEELELDTADRNSGKCGMGDSVEERLDLAAALDRLPQKQKSVIILKYYEDMKISEIASALEMPEGTVKAYLHQGKAALRVLLKEGYPYV